MKHFEELPGTIRHYLLDYKDEFREEIREKYGRSRLSDFSMEELKMLFNEATLYDSRVNPKVERVRSFITESRVLYNEPIYESLLRYDHLRLYKTFKLFTTKARSSFS